MSIPDHGRTFGNIIFECVTWRWDRQLRLSLFVVDSIAIDLNQIPDLWYCKFHSIYLMTHAEIRPIYGIISVRAMGHAVYNESEIAKLDSAK